MLCPDLLQSCEEFISVHYTPYDLSVFCVAIFVVGGVFGDQRPAGEINRNF